MPIYLVLNAVLCMAFPHKQLSKMGGVGNLGLIVSFLSMIIDMKISSLVFFSPDSSHGDYKEIRKCIHNGE